MARKPRVTTTRESETGRNERFVDNRTGREMNRNEFVDRIRAGLYPDYHIRSVNGVATPASNPDESENNNLD